MKSTSNLHRTNAYLASNSTTRNGKILATFTEQNSGRIKSFILKTSAKSETINVNSATSSGSVSGICDYSCSYDNGKLNVTILNLSTSTEVIVNSVEIPPITNLQITATNNAPNSLLILTIMDGSTQIAEYSCISGTISANLSLDQNKTYKILATRPFGSRLTATLDDATLSPTNFASYTISTETKSAMNLTFTLSGDGSWKNMVVV